MISDNIQKAREFGYVEVGITGGKVYGRLPDSDCVVVIDSEPLPANLYCDDCGEELQREACGHVRPCLKCVNKLKNEIKRLEDLLVARGHENTGPRSESHKIIPN